MNIKHLKQSMAAAALTALVSLPAMADYRIVYPSGGAEKTNADAGLAPSLVSAEVNASTITLTYNKELDNTANNTHFTVSIPGQSYSVTSLNSTSGEKTIDLNLSAAVTDAMAVTLSYTDPSTGNDTYAIQSAEGNDAPSFSQLVTNVTPGPPQLVSATFSGAGTGSYQYVTMIFDGVLSPPYICSSCPTRYDHPKKFSVYSDGYGAVTPHYITFSALPNDQTFVRLQFINRSAWFAAPGTYLRYSSSLSTLRTGTGLVVPSFRVDDENE